MTNLEHYRQLKAGDHGDDMLHLFQIGEFWEAYEDDARLLRALLDLRMILIAQGGEQFEIAFVLDKDLDAALDRIAGAGLHVTTHAEVQPCES